ncbi:MAG: RagB/SusD family nutrient uptake outer membrane protein, partial [Odoribacter sp.]|nr:RagB/SusD family nutrient uptake outer membrane protein [Odoribacter sp.]
MKKYIFLFLSTWLLASCSNFLEEYSQDQAKVESYKDLDELLIGDGYWRPHTFYTEGSTPMETGDPFLLALHLMPDEVDVYRLCKPSLELQEDFFGYITWQEQVGRTFKGSATLNDEDKDWNELYKRINIANQIIGEIDKQEAADDRERLEILRVKGEAYFLRACYYFTLVNMYARPYDPTTAVTEAGIPLKLSQDIEDKEYTSSSLQDVYAVILDDLATARECLGRTEVKNHPYRADIVAAHLLTSRVCLYMQDWQHAYDHADSVINRKGALEDLNGYDGGNFLNRRSKETVFSMGGHILSAALQNKSNFPNFIISDAMLSLYDESDLRRGTYIREMTPILTGSNGKGSPVWVYNKDPAASYGRTPQYKERNKKKPQHRE